VRDGLPGDRSLRHRHLRPGLRSAHQLQPGLCRPHERPSELRCLRQCLPRRARVREQRLRLPERHHAVRRSVREHDRGQRQLRRVRNTVHGRSFVHGFDVHVPHRARLLRSAVRRSTDRSEPLWSLRNGV
jgi:hypothetical protein